VRRWSSYSLRRLRHRYFKPFRRASCKSPPGGAFLGFGHPVIGTGLDITPLLYCGHRYLALLFVMSKPSAAGVGQNKDCLWILIVVGGGFGLSMFDANFYLIAARAGQRADRGDDFLLGLSPGALRKEYLKRSADHKGGIPAGEDGVAGREGSSLGPTS